MSEHSSQLTEILHKEEASYIYFSQLEYTEAFPLYS